MIQNNELKMNSVVPNLKQTNNAQRQHYPNYCNK